VPLTVAVAGASGYAAAELFRLLSVHPDVTEVRAYSRRPEAVPLPGHVQVRPYGDLFAEGADVVFLSLPADAARAAAKELVASGRVVIDLSGGHRLPEARYRAVYGDAESEGAGQAVYGLTEWFRDELKGQRLVANPGCYATAMALLLLPLAAEGLIPDFAVADGISGHSGAGRAEKGRHLLAEASEDVSPYRLTGHPHAAEVEEVVGARAGKAFRLHFTPHLAPLSRGLVTTIHLPLDLAPERLAALYQERYHGSPFVQVLPPGQDPRTRHVLGTNVVELAVAVDRERGFAVLTAALDNLGKGAAGQAIQNMNVLLGLPEERGLLLPTFAV
jgi:N-acetyl-gamma-glutamyl-phosphate reductase